MRHLLRPIGTVFNRGMILMIICMYALLSISTVEMTFGIDQRKSEGSMIDLRPTDKDKLGIYKSDPIMYEQAVSIGCKVVNLPNYGTFFVYWFPRGFESSGDKRVLVVLHGTNGNAYQQLLQFATTAKRELLGIISIQWGWPSGEVATEKNQGMVAKARYYEYLSPEKTYEFMCLALNYVAVHDGTKGSEAACYGFDRAASHCVTYAMLDKTRGGNFFSLFIAASGDTNENLQTIRKFQTDGTVKPVLAGKKFYLWCGKEDGGSCDQMRQIKQLIESLAGSVEIFREVTAPKDGFNRNKQYQAEAVQLWRELPNKTEKK